MINREMIQASLLTYSTTLDEYRQPRTVVSSETPIQITKPKLYQHREVEDIRFQDVTDSCLTLDLPSDTNELKVNDVVYLIKFVNPEGRLHQVFLKKK